MMLYKITQPDGTAYNGGSGRWSLPTDTEPGAWWRIDGALEACVNGLHVTDAEHIDTWVGGQPFVLHRVETAGPIIRDRAKYVVGAARLLPRKRPAPDMTAAHTAYNLALHRADTARAKAIGTGARGYLRAIGPVRLPVAHPLRDKVESMARAERTYQTAISRAQSRYDAILSRAMDPEDA
jgi:hypothetical protein